MRFLPLLRFYLSIPDDACAPGDSVLERTKEGPQRQEYCREPWVTRPGGKGKRSEPDAPSDRLGLSRTEVLPYIAIDETCCFCLFRPLTNATSSATWVAASFHRRRHTPVRVRGSRARR